MELIDYIGKPYVSGGRGPCEFDCWGFVMHYVKNTKGIMLPDQPMRPEETMAVLKAFKNEAAHGNWNELVTPEDGCIIACGKGRHFSHAGVLAQPHLVLHASRDAGQVAAQSLFSFRRAWPLLKFYEYKVK